MTHEEKIIERLKTEQKLSAEELDCLLTTEDTEAVERLRAEARTAAQAVYGKQIYIRGLIEFTNYCKNDCYYCGIRRGNACAERYRLTKEQILSCCAAGYELGFRTFVLQGGEGIVPVHEVCSLVSEIKERYPDCAVTLSLGEYIRSEYEQMYYAGASRYSLHHITADKEHFERLHPRGMSFDSRMSCLRELKDIGFRIGCGFVVGSPYQTPHMLAKELKFIEELQPDMCDIIPFVPHKDTPFSSFPSGSLLQTAYLLSLVRLIKPNLLLPSAAILDSIAEDGRERSIKAGANAVTVDLSPMPVCDKYSLHDCKTDVGEIKQELEQLRTLIERLGYRAVFDGGEVKR